MIPIAGYANRWSVGPNEQIEFKISSTFAEPYLAKLMRITCADPNPDGPGIIEHDLSSVFSGQFQSRFQEVNAGSYGVVPVDGKLPDFDKFGIGLTFWPTLLEGEHQSLISLHGSDGEQLLDIFINEESVLCASVRGETTFSSSTKLEERCWYGCWIIIFGVESAFVLTAIPRENGLAADFSDISSFENSELPSLGEIDKIIFAASDDSPARGCFNGKLEMPSIFDITSVLESLFENENKNLQIADDDIIASWDFYDGIETQELYDSGLGELDGYLVNCPTRAVRGSFWFGREMCYRYSPDEYGAIHFHDDDLSDCKWETDFTFTVPEIFRSAMYSMRIECGGVVEDIPFYVRPRLGRPRSRIAVLVSTLTYTVYSNQARGIAGPDYDKLVAERKTRPWTPDEIKTYGLSTYNLHRDGSGICYASIHRPSLTMRPNYMTVCRPYAGSGMRHLPADTHLLAWLEHLGYSYDIVTDDDLQEDGFEIIAPYDVVMTVSHPEYHTPETLDSIYEYSRTCGHLMYLGGNGFYWKVAVSDELPGVVEIRRAEGGIRAWASEPGEYYNSFDGEYGGLWLRNGRPPQELVGVGFTGQGDFEGTYYRRNPNLDSKYDWVFEGIDDEVLGDFGLSGGGAAGFELDRIDHSLGTPANAVVLASSETYPDHFVLVPEEMLTHQKTRTGEPAEKLIRSDMVIFPTDFGGYVFSVGSICYCGSLPWNNFDNNISKLTQNVLQYFLEN